jgi:hypothetical protein
LRVKNAKEANNKLVEVSDDLDDLLDHSEEDEEPGNQPLSGIIKSIATKNSRSKRAAIKQR